MIPFSLWSWLWCTWYYVIPIRGGWEREKKEALSIIQMDSWEEIIWQAWFLVKLIWLCCVKPLQWAFLICRLKPNIDIISRFSQCIPSQAALWAVSFVLLVLCCCHLMRPYCFCVYYFPRALAFKCSDASIYGCSHLSKLEQVALPHFVRLDFLSAFHRDGFGKIATFLGGFCLE